MERLNQHSDDIQSTIKTKSPLYGEEFIKAKQKVSFEVAILNEPEILEAVHYAAEVFQTELENKGYTPLTVNSYSSAVNRFIDFLEEGEVIPDFDNKTDNKKER